MSERMTIARVETRAENVNRRLAERGSRVRYEIGRRNGYTALDRTDAKSGKTLDLIRIGTKQEIADWLEAAMVALDDSRRAS